MNQVVNNQNRTRVWFIAMLLLSFSLEGEVFGVEGIAPQVQTQAHFKLLETASVSKEHVYLSDVASCSGTEAVCTQVYGVTVADAPMPGKNLVLGSRAIERILAIEFPDTEVRVSGAANTTVTAVSHEVQPDRIRLGLEEAFRTKIKNPGFRIVVKKVQTSRKILIRSDSFSLGFPDIDDMGAAQSSQPEWLYSRFNGSRSVLVEFLVAGKVAHAESITVSSTVEARAWASIRNLRRGDIVRSRDFELAWVPLKRGQNQLASNFKQVSGKMLRQSLRIGNPIRLDQVTTIKIVKRGDTLKLTTISSGLKIISEVKALANGGYGEHISAVQLKTGKKLKVQITGRGKAQFKL